MQNAGLTAALRAVIMIKVVPCRSDRSTGTQARASMATKLPTHAVQLTPWLQKRRIVDSAAAHNAGTSTLMRVRCKRAIA